MPQPAKVEGALWRKGVYYLNKRGFKRRSLHTADPKQAKAEVAKLLAQNATDKARVDKLASGRLKWTDAVVRYHDEIAVKSLRPGTLKRYMVSFGSVHEHLHYLHLDEITTFILVNLASARKAQGVSNSTINRDLTAVNRVLACAVAWGVSSTNPGLAFDRRLLTKEVREPRGIPSDADIEKVASACHGLFAQAVRFARLEGARQGEIFSLEWSAVYLESRSVTFNRTKTSSRKGIPRTIELSEQGLSLLKSLPRPPLGDYVFWHGIGERYSRPASQFARVRHIVGAKTGVPEFTFHDLRHTYAIRSLLGGTDIYDLARHLGHSSVKMTESYLGWVPNGSPVSRVTKRTPPTDEHNGSDLPDPS